MKKLFTAVCLVALIMASSNYGFAGVDGNTYGAGHDEVTGGKVVIDLLFLRPFGIASFAVGTGFFIAALPFSVITGSMGSTADVLVKKPFVYTFVRKMGED
ncbi:MAG: hypothetical protein ACE5EB_03380 [Thermodesulfobacteriota bacterium]